MEESKENQLMQALAKEVATKPSIPKLAAAFVKAWGEIQNVVKNAVNPHFKNDYATLDAVIDAVKPTFAKYELALLQSPAECVQLANGTTCVSLVGLLIHSSGETISIKSQIPIGDKATPQAVGSALTYLRRYQESAVAGLAQVDDDGQAGAAPKKESKKDAARNADPSYASVATALIAEIDSKTTIEDVEALRPRVKELGDKLVIDAFVARKETIKNEKKKVAA